jgi:hypothetical protein
MTARLSPRCVALMALALASALPAEPGGQGQGTTNPQPGDPAYVEATPVYPSGTPYYAPPANVPDAEMPDPHFSLPYSGSSQPVVPSSQQFLPQPYTPGYDPNSVSPPPVIYTYPAAPAGYEYPPQPTDGPARLEPDGQTTGTYYGTPPQTFQQPVTMPGEPAQNWVAPSDDIQDMVPGQQQFQAPYAPPVAPTNFLPETPSEGGNAPGFVTDGDSRGRHRR